MPKVSDDKKVLAEIRARLEATWLRREGESDARWWQRLRSMLDELLEAGRSGDEPDVKRISDYAA